MNIQCSCGSRSFVKERKALKMSQPSEYDSDQLSAIIEADPLKTTREVAAELNVDHSMVIWHLKQIEKVKSSISGCLWAVCKSKILSFEVCLLRNNGKPFLDQLVMCNEMWILYDHWQRPSVTGPRRSSKALPKVKLAPKKIMVAVWWSAAGLNHFNFLNPGKTITSEKYAQRIDEIHRKLLCLQLAVVNRMGLILHEGTRLHVAQATLQKLNK